MNIQLQTDAHDDDGRRRAGISRRCVLQLSGLTGAGILAPGLLAGCWGSKASSYEATVADARGAIAKALTDTSTPSISVALMDRDRVIWAEAFGLIDPVSKAVPTPDTLFCIGSCSKMLAAIATMILVERSQLELDQPLVRYLGNFRMASPEYTQVTVRMLLSHSSGFPGADYRGLFGAGPRTDYAVQVMQTLATVRLKHAPGEMSVYCNDGFTMIEPLVQTITGKTYAQFVADEILAPLGMPRSRYPLALFAEGSFAPGFTGAVKQPQEFTQAYASGGLYSTPSEMGRLARMLLNDGQLDGKRILQPASIAEMARDQTLTEPLRPVKMADGFGLGWDGVRQGGLAAVGVTAWHKNGGTSVYGSDFFVVPDEGLALMITGSSTGYGSGALAERILLNALLERRRIDALPVPLVPTPGPQGLATDEQLSTLTGVYAHYQGLLCLQALADRTLALSSYADGSWVVSPDKLKLRNDGTWSSDASPNSAFVAASAQGQTYLVARVPSGMGHYLFEVPYAQKMQAKAPLSAAWQARLARKWLAVNDAPDSAGLLLGGPLLTLAAVPDLPGYILTRAEPIDKNDQIGDASASDTVAQMCLKIPFVKGRDLDDVLIEMRNGEEWVRLGSSLFRPAQTVPVLASGTQVLKIGTEGYCEWRTVQASTAPLQITLSAGSAWRIYNSNFQLLGSGAASGPATLPTGTGLAYLMLFGAANTLITVSLA